METPEKKIELNRHGRRVEAMMLRRKAYFEGKADKEMNRMIRKFNTIGRVNRKQGAAHERALARKGLTEIL